ncbi:hypothetical protein GCM10017600_14400 [Streptosporangium carneum]|uniref:Uncharacterized protein n=1 Tax=Streptosporangium carneum TaxID=47481 RepID=A0A9W6MBQ4_9ACTN|nr:hypothetical protein GCM10017600_14400 [Streptosporangium carneum]
MTGVARGKALRASRVVIRVPEDDTTVREKTPLGRLATMVIADPSQEDVVLSRPGAWARHAGLAPVQNFLFAHTPSVVVYDCR